MAQKKKKKKTTHAAETIKLQYQDVRNKDDFRESCALHVSSVEV